MIVYIKNMVCDRCIMVVRQQLENIGLNVGDVNLGSADVQPDPDVEQLRLISSQLKLLGFEVLDNEKDQMVERIKT